MYTYKDFSYIKYILNLPYREGLELYCKSIQRSADLKKQKDDDMLFQLFLFDVEHGNFEGNFQDYKKRKEIKVEDTKMDQEKKKKEENRIIEASKKIIELDRRARNAGKRISRST